MGQTTASKDAPGPVRMVCRTCGSDAVTRDAWAAWHEGEQRWQISALFDHAFCHDCMAAVQIDAVPG